MSTHEASPVVTQSRERFHILDGLRGAAAIAVVLYHLGIFLRLPFLAPRGYLAADFFFMLSGLVMAHAYSRRLRYGMTVARFCEKRIIRLYPMMVLATLFAATLASFSLRRDPPGQADILIAAAMGSLGVPMLFSSSLPAMIFPLNGPLWSTFFELIANVSYALTVKRKGAGVVAFVIAAASLGGIAAGVAIWGGMNIGWRVANWQWGFPRAGFSFFIGVMLNRYRIECPRLPRALSVIAVITAFFIPIGGRLGGLVDVAVVILVFPLTIASLSQQQLPIRWLKLCDFAAGISYPIYTLHFPICMALGSIYILVTQPWPVRLGIASGVTVLLIYLSRWLFRFIDAPFRASITSDLRAMRQSRTAL